MPPRPHDDSISAASPLVPKNVVESGSTASMTRSYDSLEDSGRADVEKVTKRKDYRYDDEETADFDFSSLGGVSCRCCRRDNTSEEVPSNETLLSVAFVSFLAFTTVEFFVALYARSHAMMADSVSMFVDAATYAFNLCAERNKASSSRRRRLVLELVPPLLSVCTLTAVNVFVTRDAVLTLLSARRGGSGVAGEGDEDQPDVSIMFFFSAVNLAVDMLNVSCFARAKKLLGFAVVEEDSGEGRDGKGDGKLGEKAKIASSVYISQGGDTLLEEAFHFPVVEAGCSYQTRVGGDAVLYNVSRRDDDDSTNLNMCSAYTHVFADTLRSVAVMVAAAVAALVDFVAPDVADAVATIVISVIITVSLVPLFRGLARTSAELRAEMMGGEEGRKEGEVEEECLHRTLECKSTEEDEEDSELDSAYDVPA